MIRVIKMALLATLLFPAAGRAETVRVTSGTHDQFSRLVLDFSGPQQWSLGRRPGGYEFRTESSDVDFDLSDAFRLLLPEHILNVRQDGPGRLLIDLGCPCHADGFDFRGDRVVLDIVEGPAPLDAQFENPLPSSENQGLQDTIANALNEAIADSQITSQNVSGARGAGLAFAVPQLTSPSPDLLSTAPNPLSPEIMVGDDNSSQQPTDFVARIPLPKEADVPNLTTTKVREEVEPSVATIVPSELVPTNDPANGTTPSAVQLPPIVLGSAESGVGVFANTSGLGVPNLPAQQRSEQDRARVQDAQSNLLSQLQRAVVQGLIQVPTEVPDQYPAEPTPQVVDAPSTLEPENTIEETPDRRAHVFIETATDRDALDPVVQALRQNSARDCWPQDWFDIPTWAGDLAGAPTLEGLRSELVGEFDRVNGDTAMRLAQRYLYMGFGLEALAVLRTFEIDTPQAMAMIEFGQTMDLKFGQQSETFLRQRVCASPTAIWAIVADPSFSGDADVKLREILKHFSALPEHLRNHIGPLLAQRFIAADDLETAKAIRNIIDRSPEADETALDLIDAQVELGQDNVEAASPLLEMVVAQDGPEAALALAELIENRFAEELPIDEKLAKSADALAVEYRGTPTGARLVKASIRAFSVAGEPSTTFDRIFDALENGSISEDEARVLRAEAHLGSAQFASDVNFLRYAFLFPFEEDLLEGVERRARREVATRLLAHGLLERAKLTLPPDVDAWTDEDRLIAAGIALAEDDPLRAIGYVRNQSSPEARLISAKALRRAGELSAAMQIFADQGLHEAANQLAWQAGDWEHLLTTENETYSNAARLGAGMPLEDALSDTDAVAQVEAIDLAASKPLAQGRAMLGTSRKTREVLEDLLRNSSGQEN